MDMSQVIAKLKAQKIRITVSRKSLIDIFLSMHAPLSAEELDFQLKSRGHQVNKTTIYRELDFLKQHHLIHEIDLGDGKKRFENALGDHHHHLICNTCRKIEELDCHPLEKALSKFEKTLGLTHGYTKVRHSLEFFGICQDCRR